MKKDHSSFWQKSETSNIELPKSSSIPIDQFIFQSIESGYNTILIGEQHNGLQGGMEALSQIAKKLQRYAEEHQITIAVFAEGSQQRTNESQPLPLSKETLQFEAEELYSQGIPVYGLENTETDPSIFLENASIEKINQFLKEQDLFESFITLHHKKHIGEEPLTSLEESSKRILKKTGSSIYLLLALNAFGNSDQRIILPNQTFSSYINSMPSDTICIAVVGAKHIPTASRNQNIIDIGMQALLEQSRKTISTFIIPAYEKMEAPYQPTNDHDVEYSTIDHISYSVPIFSLIHDEIDNAMELLITENIGQKEINSKIAFLNQLKKAINETNPSTTLFSELLDNCLKESKKSVGFSSSVNKFFSSILSKNQNTLFGSSEKSNILQTFIEDLRKKYGHYTMNVIQPSRNQNENITNNNNSITFGLDQQSEQ